MELLLTTFENRTKDFLSVLRTELGGIRTNRPNAQLVEDLKVDYFGQLLPVKQLGSIGINPPREVVVTAWDRNAAAAIAKAVQNSSLGITPTVDGGAVRFQLPPLTSERREELAKLAKAIAEKIRIRLRGARDEANKEVAALFDAKELSEDQKFKAKKQVQEITDATNQAIEDLVAKKITEIHE